MATSTTRMALTKPSGSASPSEAVDIGALNTNADLLDKFAPCILVNDGVTPATGDLYDGALVKEKTSGIIWEARKNGGGTFDKVYVRYPFNMVAYTASGNQSSSSTFADLGVATWFSGKNSSAANISGSNEVKIPIKGIYTLHWHYRFTGNATGVRAGRLKINGAADGDNTEDSKPGNTAAYTSYDITITRTFAANDLIIGQMFQNSGSTLAVYTVAEISMIEPIQ